MHDSQALEQQTYQTDDAIAFTASSDIDIIELEAPGRGRYWIAYLPEDSEYIGTVIPRNTLCVYRKDEDDDLDSDALQSAIDDVLEYTNDGTNRFREQTVWVDITEQVSTAEIAALREDIAARQDTDNRGSYSYYSDSHADLQLWRVEGPLSTYGFLRFQVYPLYTRMPYIDIMHFPEGVDRYLFSPPEYEEGHVYARLHQPFADVEYRVQDLVRAVRTAQKELFWKKHRIGVITLAAAFIAIAGFYITQRIRKSRGKEPHL